MPKRNDIRSILVIGSGPIVIGQAAEFDYSGTQACKALREEGYKVVLVNSNPATIMTDLDIADVVYIEPLDVDVITQIIRKERPDGVLGTMGGQTSLNLLKELHSRRIFDEFDVDVLGTSIHAIETAEDRDMFKQSMEQAGEPVPKSKAVHSFDEAKHFCATIGYPIVVRPAYTLGGTGSGFAKDAKELELVVKHGMSQSPICQVLIEEALLGVEGWGEFEFEVLRDKNDNCIIVCPMENLDPMGIHTGESIVVAPTQTLNDADFQMLRTAAIRIIRHIKIQGACNIQFAFNHHSGEYRVIEVNPRVSRSSALASKATGYPIAKVAAKIACGLTLDEIRNDVTKETFSCFEPSIDYCVVKIPRWPFDKFRNADRRIGTQMKSTGETMAIGRTFEEALQKAIRGLEVQRHGLCKDGTELKRRSREDLITLLSNPTDMRLFHIIEALDAGLGMDEIHASTGIHPWFLKKIEHIHEKAGTIVLDENSVLEAKQLGFSDRQIAHITDTSEKDVRDFRRSRGIIPTFKMVDTCAAEFAAGTPYLYSTYEGENECIPQQRKKVLIIGSGPIRIGQGIEFDYGCVHSVSALKEEGVQAMIINNNPETVSTDFDTSDKLFFEPITFEDVMNVVDAEKPDGVILQFGGQTSINLAMPLHEAGVSILGTPPLSIDIAEDREKFAHVLDTLNIPAPPYGAATSPHEAERIAGTIGYPIIVRPSYVLGGRAMEVVHTREELLTYLQEAVKASPDHPVFLDRFLESAIELEVDALCDGTDVFVAAIMEHVEEAGIHSGDSICSIPPYSVSGRVKEKIIDFTTKISKELDVVGLINVQYAVRGDDVFVIEANPRASRTVPFVSKTIGIPLAKIATKLMLGKKLRDFGLTNYREPSFYSIKVPVFPFSKLPGMDVAFSPEMKSTGEIMACDDRFSSAFSKALLAAGIQISSHGRVLLCIDDEKEREEMTRLFVRSGFAVVKKGNGIPAEDIHERIQSKGFDAVFFSGKADSIVRAASKSGIPLIASRRSAETLAGMKSSSAMTIRRLGEFGRVKNNPLNQVV